MVLVLHHHQSMCRSSTHHDQTMCRLATDHDQTMAAERALPVQEAHEAVPQSDQAVDRAVDRAVAPELEAPASGVAVAECEQAVDQAVVLADLADHKAVSKEVNHTSGLMS